MYIYFVIGLFSFATFFFLSTLFKHLSILDKPDGIRKTHKGEIPLSGGISLYLSITISIFLLESEFIHLFTEPSIPFKVFLISLIPLFLGLWDDIRPLPTSIRLIFQILASWLVIIMTDVYLTDLGDLLGFGNIYLGSLGIPLTIFMVVGVCNAFNMLDGMDGLVGIVFLVLSLSISLLSYFNSSFSVFFFISLITIVFLIAVISQRLIRAMHE